MTQGEACLELDGLIQLASLWDWIRAHEASQYFCGLEYVWVVIVFVASFIFILQYTSIGRMSGNICAL